ncbi:MAG: hypothetical protein DF168_01916 [Candidatus Moanabacter tarae]|uniref:SGNH hydrolase-type esterase domain-containing protein n=1 Tax=Candidatus Moanibacter tarae TaxID=2200854 RepID=A0A2Z4AKD4_9BACT|nr:MAG: hypothetical protein DF168_01916 [Candidatus Moanabacter tarae]
MKRFLSISFEIYVAIWTCFFVLDDLGIKVADAALYLLFLPPAFWFKIILRLDNGLLPKTIDLKVFGSWYQRRREIFAMGVSVILCFLTLELGFRNYFHLLPQTIANEVGTGYSEWGRGIDYKDHDTRTFRMRPEYSREMYFNGYRWYHQTDSRGFRNDIEYTSANIVLIGDSMIYGHGVESDFTVASNLEQLTGRKVYNMGKQGASIHEEFQFLLRDALLLAPDWVFVFFLNNDLNDLTVKLSAEEQINFINSAVSNPFYSYVSKKARGAKPILHALEQRLLYSPTLRLYRAGTLYLRKWCRAFGAELLAKARATLVDQVQVPPMASIAKVRLPEASKFSNPESNHKELIESLNHDDFLGVYKGSEPFISRPDYLRAMRFQLHALKKIQFLGQQDTFNWGFVYIYTGQQYDGIYDEIFGKFCKIEGIEYLSLRETFETEKHSRLFLPNDGHFSPKGAYITAQALSEHFPLSD